MMEALASGLSVIASNIRGARDLIDKGLFDPYSSDSVALVIKSGEYGKGLSEEFSIGVVQEKMLSIYVHD